MNEMAVEPRGSSTTRREAPRVGVVSVTYNRAGELLTLLGQLRDIDFPKQRFDIYLVDNASVDDTVENVRERFPEVHVIESDVNLGTSAGFNLGMRAALESRRHYDYIWLLDSDAEVEPNTLPPLIESMEADDRIGVVGSTIFDPRARERLVTSGLLMNWRRGNVVLNKSIDNASNELVEADLIPACSLLIRSSVCREIGLWDERFWVYWGDTDWCQRVLRRGYRVCSHIRSRTWHRDWANTKRGFNAPTVLYDDLRGALLFNLRYAPEGSLRGARSLILRSYLKAALEELTQRPHFGTAMDEAIKDCLAGDFGKQNYQPGPPELRPAPVGEIAVLLADELGTAPRVLLDQIRDVSLRTAVREAFHRPCPDAIWREVEPIGMVEREDFTTSYGYFVRYELPRLARGLIGGRHDVVIAEVGSPHLYMLVTARFTLLIDDQGNGILRKSSVLRGFSNLFKTLATGVKRAFFDLPRTFRSGSSLKRAIGDFGTPLQPSSSVR